MNILTKMKSFGDVSKQTSWWSSKNNRMFLLFECIQDNNGTDNWSQEVFCYIRTNSLSLIFTVKLTHKMFTDLLPEDEIWILFLNSPTIFRDKQTNKNNTKQTSQQIKTSIKNFRPSNGSVDISPLKGITIQSLHAYRNIDRKYVDIHWCFLFFFSNTRANSWGAMHEQALDA